MKIVLSGSSSGIGRAITESLLTQGHHVWGLARSAQTHFPQAEGKFNSSQCDVADWSQVETSAQQIIRSWKNVDAIITCAGVQGAIGPAMQSVPENWSSTIRANLDGTFFVLRALFAHLSQAENRSKIICFSGGGSTKPRINFSAYGVAKTGVVRLVETLSEEWKAQPIDINAIAPGAIYTRLTEEVLKLGLTIVGQAEYDSALKQKPDGGASLQKVAGLIDFLLSTKSDGISGRLLSAPWDPWSTLDRHRDVLARSDIYTLRRIIPEERNIVLS